MNKSSLPLTRIHVLALAVALLVALNSLWLDMFHTLDNRLSDFLCASSLRNSVLIPTS